MDGWVNGWKGGKEGDREGKKRKERNRKFTGDLRSATYTCGGSSKKLTP